MPATHHFNKSDCKHSFAYNEQGLMVFIEDAEDHVQYYLTPDKRVKLANKFNYKERQKHWAIVPEYIVINGERIRVDSDSYGESREHNEFKAKIFKKFYFYYKGHKVLLNDPKEEFIIKDSKFRADIHAYLDGVKSQINSRIIDSRIKQLKRNIEQGKREISEVENRISREDFGTETTIESLKESQIATLERRIERQRSDIAEAERRISAAKNYLANHQEQIIRATAQTYKRMNPQQIAGIAKVRITEWMPSCPLFVDVENVVYLELK
jgi:Mg2+ and Co2+ transporter CorA